MKCREFFKSLARLSCAAAILLWTQPSLLRAEGATTVPVYRFYFNPAQSHLYNTTPTVPGDGWQPEGVAFYVSPVPLPYTVPLYSVYKAKLYDHFYTIDVQARNYCIGSLGYADQGVLGYVLPTQQEIPGSSPLYRFVRVYNPRLPFGQTWVNGSPNFQDHFYKADPSTPKDYSPEGLACRVWASQVPLPQALLQIDSPGPGKTLQVGQPAILGWKVWGGSGYIRLSFSRDSGASWQVITSVGNAGIYGSMNASSFLWTVPPQALNKVMIRADWTKDTSGATPPWATVTTGAFPVDSATTPAPNAPILAATLKGDNAAYLSWKSDAAGVTGFSVERKTQGGAYMILSTVVQSTYTYGDSNLAPGTTYVYRIRAWIGGKPSNPSNEVTLTTPRPNFRRVN